MHPVCSGCAAPCCVGRVVPVGDDEVARLASALGVAPAAFSERGDGGGARLRRRDDASCVFAVAAGGSWRCGIEGDKPRSCRVYPYHVAVGDDGAWAAALGRDAACPPARGEAWAARVDDERARLDAAIAEADGARTRTRTLPIVGESPCFGCTTGCCLEYEVPVHAHDLWRLSRALGLPWTALVRVRPTPATWMESFTLDATGTKQALHLVRRDDGACALLVTLPDGARRCGAHAARPLACRLYPYRGDWAPGAPVRLQHDAVCPPPRRAAWDAHRGLGVDVVAAQVGERHLYLRALARWELAARTRPPADPYTVDDFVRWSFALYDAIERVRLDGADGFSTAAAALIAGFPLPDESALGC